MILDKGTPHSCESKPTPTWQHMVLCPLQNIGPHPLLCPPPNPPAPPAETVASDRRRNSTWQIPRRHSIGLGRSAQQVQSTSRARRSSSKWSAIARGGRRKINGLQPTSSGLQPRSDGLQPNSESAHCDLALAVEVRHVPNAIGSWPLRSGSAHCDLALAVLGPTAIGSLRSVRANRDLALAVEVR